MPADWRWQLVVLRSGFDAGPARPAVAAALMMGYVECLLFLPDPDGIILVLLEQLVVLLFEAAVLFCSWLTHIIIIDSYHPVYQSTQLAFIIYILVGSIVLIRSRWASLKLGFCSGE